MRFGWLSFSNGKIKTVRPDHPSQIHISQHLSHFTYTTVPMFIQSLVNRIIQQYPNIFSCKLFLDRAKFSCRNGIFVVFVWMFTDIHIRSLLKEMNIVVHILYTVYFVYTVYVKYGYHLNLIRFIWYGAERRMVHYKNIPICGMWMEIEINI